MTHHVPAATHDRPTWHERLDPVGHAWKPIVLGWITILIVVTGTGLVLVGPLADGRLVHGDVDIAKWLVDHRTPTWNTVAEIGTWLGETVTVVVVLVVAIVVAWRACSNVAAPVFLAVAVGGEKLVYLCSSLVVGRDRPPVPTIGTSYATASFPSGHVASTVTLYGGIALVIALHRSRSARYELLAVVGVLAVVVGACRMYCGFHYLTDTIAGALVAAVWLAIVYRAVLLATERGAAQRTSTDLAPDRHSEVSARSPL